MTCTCPKPSLHDRVLRAISIRNGEECSDIVTAAARLLVDPHEMEENEGLLEKLHADEEYCLLVADIDNETGYPVDDDEKAEVTALRSTIETARSMGQEKLAEDLESLLAQMEDDSVASAEPT